MWHLETFIIVLRHRLPHYFQTVISEAPRGLSSATSRWQHWAGQFLASLSSTSHILRGQNLLHKRNRKVVEAEMASCTRTHEHEQKRVSKSSQIQTKFCKITLVYKLPQNSFLSLYLTGTPSRHQKPSVSICTGPAVRISATEPQHGTALWWCNSLACWHRHKHTHKPG